MYQTNKGFTLLEIIVVLVILGVLSALGFQNIFSWIRKSESAQALHTLNTIRSQLAPCLRAHQGDPNIGCICIGKVYPHEVTDTIPMYQATADCSSPVLNYNAGTRTGFQNDGRFEYWIFNVEVDGYNLGGDAHIISFNPQGWNIAANHLTNGVQTGSIEISGKADDSSTACSTWGDLEGVC